MVKVSTGATERIDIARVTNMARFVEYLLERDFSVIALDQNGKFPIYDPVIKELRRVAVVAGNEHRGIRKGVKEKCSYVVNIPILKDRIDSLNVGVATAVALYELTKEEL